MVRYSQPFVNSCQPACSMTEVHGALAEVRVFKCLVPRGNKPRLVRQPRSAAGGNYIGHGLTLLAPLTAN